MNTKKIVLGVLMLIALIFILGILPRQNIFNKSGSLENIYLNHNTEYGGFLGFEVSVFEEDLENGSSFVFGNNKEVYVGTTEGEILRINEKGESKVWVKDIAPVEDLIFHNGVIFALTETMLHRFVDDNQDGEVDVLEDLAVLPAALKSRGQFYYVPSESRIFITMGETQNRVELSNSLLVYEFKDNKLSVWDTGFEEPTGLALHPETGETLVVDNSKKGKGELNIILKGLDYGAPNCNGFDEENNCPDSVPAHLVFEEGVYLRGMNFYSHHHFPPQFRNDLFVAVEKGGKNTPRGLIRIDTTPISGGFSSSAEVFAGGFKRPVEVQIGPNGALYVLDQGASRLYKIDAKY